jgi:hypothetical protein
MEGIMRLRKKNIPELYLIALGGQEQILVGGASGRSQMRYVSPLWGRTAVIYTDCLWLNRGEASLINPREADKRSAQGQHSI